MGKEEKYITITLKLNQILKICYRRKRKNENY